MIADYLIGYAALLQEPWCFTSDQVARLTRMQVEKFYLQPAAERSKSMRDDLDSASSAKREPTVSVPIDDKESFIGTMSANFPGKPRAKWEADWERLQKRK